MGLRVGLLGPLAAWEDGRELELGSGRQRALLAYLALHPNETVPAERIVEELWQGRPPPSAAKVLQGYVSQLRRTLGTAAIATRSSAYELRVTSTDAGEFELLLRGDEPHAALALWRGEPLAEFAFESWSQAEIRRLVELWVVALEERLDVDLDCIPAARLVPELEGLVAAHPLRERLRGQLMLALYRAGRQADALAAYADARRTLVDELGVEPGRELRALQRRILEQDPQLAPVRGLRVGRGRRRAGVLLGVGLLLVLAAAVSLVVGLAHRAPVAVPASALALVSPSGASVAERTSFSAPQSALASGDGFVWTLEGDAGTVTSIDARTDQQLATFSVPGRAVDLAYGGNAFWVLTQGPAALLRLDPRSHARTQTIRLRGFADDPLRHRPGQRSLAYADGRLWAIAGDGSAFRIDPRTARAERVDVAQAVSVEASNRAVWFGTGFAPGTAAVVRVDAASGKVVARTPVPTTVLSSFAVGGGAIWVPDLFTGEVWEVRPGAIRATSAGPGVTSVAYSNGAAWVGNEISDTLARIDPASARIAKVLQAPAPQDIAATSSGPLVLSGPSASGDELPSSACGPLEYAGRGLPHFIVASDLDFHGSPLVATTTAAAIRSVFRARRYRAGRYTVGYQSCDDSSPLAGRWDPARCDTNASLYAKTRKVIGVVGTADSGCAGEELPLLNQAPGGPVALVSPAATYDFLTRATPGVAAGMLAHLYPTHVRNFARVIAPEAAQIAAAALLARRLGLRSVAIVADREGSVVTRSHVAWFRYSARKLGIRTIVVPTSAAARVRVDGAFVASDAGGRGGALVARLRARFGRRFVVIATDYVATAAVWAGGPETAGTYLVTGEPLSKAAIAGYGRAAAGALLDAVAASDGTRSSVVAELHRGGTFAANGDPRRAAVTVLRVARRNGVADPDFPHAVLDRILRPPARIVHP